MIKALKSLAIIALAGLSVSVFAQGDLIKRKSVEDTILDRLSNARPDISFGHPRQSMISGLYQVQVQGGPTLYVTPEGDKFITGELFGIDVNGFAKLEDPFVVEERKKALASLDGKSSLNFRPAGTPKAVVYVFTDVDCGYCRKMHSQINTYREGGEQKPGYNDLGIEIRYLAYPRAGIPSDSADKLISAWCSNDPLSAITMLKADKDIPKATCDNPVAKQYELGGVLGVNGTPALLMPDGKLMPGYLPPEELAKNLGI